MDLPPCVRCGWCCKEAPCVHGSGTPCKELILEPAGKRYFCAVFLRAEREEREAIELDLFIGDGCVRAFNPDRKEILKCSNA